jgi:hypothetical protein
MSINHSVNQNSTINTGDFMGEHNLFKIIGRLEFGKARDQNQGVKTVPQTTEETSLWPQALFYSEFSSSFHHTQMKKSKT